MNMSFSQENRDSLIKVVKSKIDSMPNGFAISVALLEEGEVYHIGFIKKENQLVFSELKDSLFEIGSLNKVFTSTVLANEVLNGNLKLNKAVNKAFSYKFNDKIKLTYESLANHTSGLYPLPSNLMPLVLKNPSNPYSEYTEDLFDYYLKEELQVKKNKVPTYAYSNLGAGLLAYSLSKNAEKSFEALLKEHIFEKYNMYSTGYELNTSFVGLDENKNKTENWNLKALKGAGGLISSTNDLAKFISAQFYLDNKELNLTREETFSVNEHMSMGLGWHILYPNAQNKMFWHNGATGGFSSSVRFRSNNKTGIIILTNITYNYVDWEIDELSSILLDLLE